MKLLGSSAAALFFFSASVQAQGPTSYCTAGVSTHGCTPAINANVQPNTLHSAGCVITTSGVEGQKQGLVFYGVNNSGFAPTPWAAGSTSWRCVKPPTRRLGAAQQSGGTAGSCDGVFVIDWDQFQSNNQTALGNPWSVGDRVFAQAWYRDPLAPKTSNLSNALELTYRAPAPTPCVTPIVGMVLVPAGAFSMGSNAPAGAPYYGYDVERPVHQVTLSSCFWIGATEVTQLEYLTLMGSNPSWLHAPYNPVEQVTWHEARAYCAALTAQQAALGLLPAGYEYRLPTEAEWEYACRAGSTTEFNVGQQLFCADGCIGGSSHPAPGAPSTISCASSGHVPVASFAPNAWGIHDMHGNVLEWCLDSYSDYSANPVVDPFTTGGPRRVLRGGAWGSAAAACRSAFREFRKPIYFNRDVGFRVVLAPARAP